MTTSSHDATPPNGQRALWLWAAVLAVMAVVFWFSTDNDPEFLARKSGDLPRRSLAQELRR